MEEEGRSNRRLREFLGLFELFFLSLNFVWAVVWYDLYTAWLFKKFGLDAHWPVHYFGWQVPLWMPQSPAVLHQFVLSFVLCAPVFAALVLARRIRGVDHVLSLVAWPSAIAAFPVFALRFPDFFPSGRGISDNQTILFLEVAALLTWASLYYWKRFPQWWKTGVPILFLHFTLWAWKSGSYSFYTWRVPGEYFPRAVVMLIATACIFGFPLIGFLAALTAGWYLKTCPKHGLRAMSQTA